MNIAKNMEAIFLAVLGLVMLTGLAHATVPSRQAAPAPVSTMQVAMVGEMQVVTLTAKRPSAAEKQTLAN